MGKNSGSAMRRDILDADKNSITARAFKRLGEELEDVEVPCTQDPELWFDPHISSQHKAQKFCRACPVAEMCGDYALLAGERWGIWGGLTPEQRQSIWTAVAREKRHASI